MKSIIAFIVLMNILGIGDKTPDTSIFIRNAIVLDGSGKGRCERLFLRYGINDEKGFYLRNEAAPGIGKG